MSAKKYDAIDYRSAKKRLNRYHKFSFDMPPKGKDFTPQQKSAIRRKFNELREVIKNVNLDKGTFIPVDYKKLKKKELKDVEGHITNKGIYFKYPNAKLKKNKKTKEITVQVQIGQRRELFIPFPDHIKYDLELIRQYVEKKRKKLKPDYIRWSVYGYRGSYVYLPDEFNKYAQEKSDEEKNIEESQQIKNKPYYSGVFFGWAPKNI